MRGSTPSSTPQLSREESVPDVFRRMAEESFAPGGSPLYARLAREHADNPLVAEIAGNHKPRWEVPLRIFGGVHYLALTGRAEDPWSRFGDVLAEHRDWLARFVSEQPVQTNEVQRCWPLLPGFLTVADERPLDLIELGPSAGLNLLWDRYRYRYGDATWGPREAALELVGRAASGPPAELLTRRVAVRTRIGIDKTPIDITDDGQALLLQAFVWADQRDRLERLRRAIALARRDPPPLIRGDYVDVLPGLLARRDADALTLVFNSVTTIYLGRDDRARLEASIAEAGAAGSLAWVSYEFVGDESELADVFKEAFALEAQTWPDGRRRLLARTDGHGNRLRWLA
jgi:hypothetical protein